VVFVVEFCLDLPARHHEVKRIAVIGAGPGGLAALKIFADTPEYNSGLWHLTAFEAREQVGGVW
jgi:cation diffusion facilitator CzcD-associated flavoprotein CzcO